MNCDGREKELIDFLPNINFANIEVPFILENKLMMIVYKEAAFCTILNEPPKTKY